jgi:hypothetical protein
MRDWHRRRIAEPPETQSPPGIGHDEVASRSPALASASLRLRLIGFSAPVSATDRSIPVFSSRLRSCLVSTSLLCWFCDGFGWLAAGRSRPAMSIFWPLCFVLLSA